MKKTLEKAQAGQREALACQRALLALMEAQAQLEPYYEREGVSGDQRGEVEIAFDAASLAVEALEGKLVRKSLADQS